MKKIKTLLFLIAAAAIYTSCTKVDSKMNPEPEPEPDIVDSVPVLHYKDSTVLIRSVTKLKTNISGKYIDSNTFYIYYDSLNRKINFNSEYTNSSIPTPASSVHSYDSNGLLVQLEKNRLTDTLTNRYIYDAQNVISSAVIEKNPGVFRTEYFAKNILPDGGYSLNVNDSYSKYVYRFDFNADGQLVLLSKDLVSMPNSGFVDSIFYDAFGNVSKVVETIYSMYPHLTFTYFEFSERANRGDEFYNFNKKIYNGISNFPEFVDDFTAGSPLTGPYNEGLYQFSKYPAYNNKIYTWPTYQEVAYIDFKSDAEYDSANRLVKLKLYVGRDYHYSNEYRLTYYK